MLRCIAIITGRYVTIPIEEYNMATIKMSTRICKEFFLGFDYLGADGKRPSDIHSFFGNSTLTGHIENSAYAFQT
ncbi:unnamed protein product, partial [marine sediment metagenome]